MAGFDDAMKAIQFGAGLIAGFTNAANQRKQQEEQRQQQAVALLAQDPRYRISPATPSQAHASPFISRLFGGPALQSAGRYPVAQMGGQALTVEPTPMLEGGMYDTPQARALMFQMQQRQKATEGERAYETVQSFRKRQQELEDERRKAEQKYLEDIRKETAQTRLNQQQSKDALARVNVQQTGAMARTQVQQEGALTRAKLLQEGALTRAKLLVDKKKAAKGITPDKARDKLAELERLLYKIESDQPLDDRTLLMMKTLDLGAPPVNKAAKQRLITQLNENIRFYRQFAGEPSPPEGDMESALEDALSAAEGETGLDRSSVTEGSAEYQTLYDRVKELMTIKGFR